MNIEGLCPYLQADFLRMVSGNRANEGLRCGNYNGLCSGFLYVSNVMFF